MVYSEPETRGLYCSCTEESWVSSVQNGQEGLTQGKIWHCHILKYKTELRLPFIWMWSMRIIEEISHQTSVISVLWIVASFSTWYQKKDSISPLNATDSICHTRSMTWNLTVLQSVSALLGHFYNREGGCPFSSLPAMIPNPIGDFQHSKGTKGNQKPVG